MLYKDDDLLEVLGVDCQLAMSGDRDAGNGLRWLSGAKSKGLSPWGDQIKSNLQPVFENLSPSSGGTSPLILVNDKSFICLSISSVGVFRIMNMSNNVRRRIDEYFDSQTCRFGRPNKSISIGQPQIVLSAV